MPAEEVYTWGGVWGMHGPSTTDLRVPAEEVWCVAIAVPAEEVQWVIIRGDGEGQGEG